MYCITIGTIMLNRAYFCVESTNPWHLYNSFRKDIELYSSVIDDHTDLKYHSFTITISQCCYVHFITYEIICYI